MTALSIPAGHLDRIRSHGRDAYPLECCGLLLGRADAKTFKIVEVSNPWFAENLRSVIPQWRFTPALLAGCKVRRVYKFSATAKPRA